MTLFDDLRTIDPDLSVRERRRAERSVVARYEGNPFVASALAGDSVHAQLVDLLPEYFSLPAALLGYSTTVMRHVSDARQLVSDFPRLSFRDYYWLELTLGAGAAVAIPVMTFFAEPRQSGWLYGAQALMGAAFGFCRPRMTDDAQRGIYDGSFLVSSEALMIDHVIRAPRLIE